MNETVGSRLKRMRKACGLTQAELGAKVGLVQGAIGNIEAGNRGYGSSIVAIAKVLGTSPDYLQFDGDNPVALIAALGVEKNTVFDKDTPFLSDEATRLACWFDKLPNDPLIRLKVSQACTQSILEAMQPTANQPTEIK